MFRFALLKEHTTWEDYIGIFLGVLIGLAPQFAGQSADVAVTLNAVVVGILVLLFAAIELVHPHRSEEIAEFLCGVWLMASPFVFGYAGAGQLRWWHFVLGALVAFLAALEYWQDWKLSAQEIAKHGQ
jgi:hypothetical protein